MRCVWACGAGCAVAPPAWSRAGRPGGRSGAGRSAATAFPASPLGGFTGAVALGRASAPPPETPSDLRSPGRVFPESATDARPATDVCSSPLPDAPGTAVGASPVLRCRPFLILQPPAAAAAAASPAASWSRPCRRARHPARPAGRAPGDGGGLGHDGGHLRGGLGSRGRLLGGGCELGRGRAAGLLRGDGGEQAEHRRRGGRRRRPCRPARAGRSWWARKRGGRRRAPARGGRGRRRGGPDGAGRSTGLAVAAAVVGRAGARGGSARGRRRDRRGRRAASRRSRSPGPAGRRAGSGPAGRAGR